MFPSAGGLIYRLQSLAHFQAADSRFAKLPRKQRCLGLGFWVICLLRHVHKWRQIGTAMPVHKTGLDENTRQRTRDADMGDQDRTFVYCSILIAEVGGQDRGSRRRNKRVSRDFCLIN